MGDLFSMGFGPFRFVYEFMMFLRRKSNKYLFIKYSGFRVFRIYIQLYSWPETCLRQRSVTANPVASYPLGSLGGCPRARGPRPIVLGPQALMTNHIWGSVCFLPQGPFGPIAMSLCKTYNNSDDRMYMLEHWSLIIFDWQVDLYIRGGVWSGERPTAWRPPSFKTSSTTNEVHSPLTIGYGCQCRILFCTKAVGTMFETSKRT